MVEAFTWEWLRLSSSCIVQGLFRAGQCLALQRATVIQQSKNLKTEIDLIKAYRGTVALLFDTDGGASLLAS